MYFNHTINHMIPGRIRLTIPALADIREQKFISDVFESLNGIKSVRIVPLIQSIVIEYDVKILNHKQILQCINLFFYQPNQEDSRLLQNPIEKAMRNNILKSGVSGILLLISLLRKNRTIGPGPFDYLAVISTSYAVLSHGENKLSHPDVITGILSMLSLGTENILQISTVTWIVNLIEVINDLRKNSYFIYQ